MVEEDTHVVWDQFNMEGLKGSALSSHFRTTIESRLGRDSWRLTTTAIFCFDNHA